LLDVDVDVDVDVDKGVVVVEVADEVTAVVVDVVAESGVIANPQPCDGSFNASGSETGDWDGVEVDGGEVVVVVLVLEPDGLVAVVVVDDVVVEDAADVLFVSSSPIPVRRSAMSTTERMIRRDQRRWGKALRELRILSLR
jgi:hypothetical protein